MKTSTTPAPTGATGGRVRRKSISDRTRFEVFKRDGFRCRYCGATADTAALHVDHGVPLVAGGADEFANYVTACHLCNSGKGPISLHTPGRIPTPRRPSAPDARRADSRCPVHGQKMEERCDQRFVPGRRSWFPMECPHSRKGCTERAVIFEFATRRVEWLNVDEMLANSESEPCVTVPAKWWAAITAAIPRPWPREIITLDLTRMRDDRVLSTSPEVFAARWGRSLEDVAAILRYWDWREESPG